MPRTISPEPVSGESGSGSAMAPESWAARSRWRQAARSEASASSDSRPVMASSGHTAAMSARADGERRAPLGDAQAFHQRLRVAIAIRASKRHGASRFRTVLDHQPREGGVGDQAAAQEWAVCEDRIQQGPGASAGVEAERAERLVAFALRGLSPQVSMKFESRFVADARAGRRYRSSSRPAPAQATSVRGLSHRDHDRTFDFSDRAADLAAESGPSSGAARCAARPCRSPC